MPEVFGIGFVLAVWAAVWFIIGVASVAKRHLEREERDARRIRELEADLIYERQRKGDFSQGSYSFQLGGRR